MSFRIGYYADQKGQIVYLNCLAITSGTCQESVIYTDACKINWIESKAVWLKNYQWCANQLEACQQFQRNKLSQ